jgi:hypothetical protein
VRTIADEVAESVARGADFVLGVMNAIAGASKSWWPSVRVVEDAEDALRTTCSLSADSTGDAVGVEASVRSISTVVGCVRLMTSCSPGATPFTMGMAGSSALDVFSILNAGPSGAAEPGETVASSSVLDVLSILNAGPAASAASAASAVSAASSSALVVLFVSKNVEILCCLCGWTDLRRLGGIAGGRRKR